MGVKKNNKIWFPCEHIFNLMSTVEKQSWKINSYELMEAEILHMAPQSVSWKNISLILRINIRFKIKFKNLGIVKWKLFLSLKWTGIVLKWSNAVKWANFNSF